jgi:iron complex outermembrane recepter protein
MKKFELFGASAIAMIMAAPAAAQTAPAEKPQAAAEDSADSGEIIVTASKRQTTLQDTPISVAVTSADTIQKAQIRDLIDLQTVVPSLRVSQNQSSIQATFIIRGFGNGANNAGIEPAVGVFIDGVYRSRSGAQISDLPNLQRIEVLRGPQSTLFGKNASAGIISIVTKEPSFKFGGNAELTYGRFNAFIAKASVTGPITDKLAFSLSGNYNRRDGYSRDLALNSKVNGRNRYGVRGDLLFQADDTLKFRLIGDYDKIDEVCCTVVNVLNGPTGALINAVGGRIDPNNPFSYNVYNNLNSTNKIDNYGVSLQTDKDFGKFKLTSITAYRKSNSLTNQDSDFTSADIIGENKFKTNISTFTSELRANTNFDGPLNFLVGSFYFNEKIKVNGDLLFGRDFRPYAGLLIRPAAAVAGAAGGNAVVAGLEGSLAPFGVRPGSFFAQGQGRFENYDYKDRAFSLFGDATLKLGDKLTLTGGLNYTNDRKQVVQNNVSTDVFSALDLVGIGVAGGLARAGVNPANPAAVAAFAAANPAVFAAIQAGAANPATNPLLGLRPFQFIPPYLNFPNAVESGITKDSNVSYTGRIAYKISSRVNAYVTYATGFKATSVNLSTDSRPFARDFPAIIAAGLNRTNLAAGSRSAAPEKASNIELGIKAQLPGLRLNFALFKETIRDFQNNTFIGTGFILNNAGKESVRGFEFDAEVSPIKPLVFTFSGTYLDAKYDSFPISAFGDISGTRPAGIPQYSITVGGDYTKEFSGGTKLNFHGDFHHESKVKIVDGDPATVPSARYFRTINDLNASIGLELTNGLGLSVWARNLTNDQYLSTVFPSVVQAGSVSGYPSQPRTYGVTGRFKF